MSLRLPTSFSVIFGSFTLGLYVAIQGPTLMDLIDLLHVNNDIMSYSLAFASLAYSIGGLLSGFLFNYVNRQILISAYFLVFGISNIATPFISNYLIFSVITVFKMMCAGGTDCGANVWILEMWPGQDAWLQALHFSFAVGCALGPLIVEPFLSQELKAAEDQIDKIAGKTSGTTTINDQNETRIHIPYGVSGLASILAALFILYLYTLEQRKKRQATKLRLKQQAASGEHILLTATQHPAALEAGISCITEEVAGQLEEDEQQQIDTEQQMVVVAAGGGGGKQVDGNVLTESAVFLPRTVSPIPTRNSTPEAPTINANSSSTTNIPANCHQNQQQLVLQPVPIFDSKNHHQHQNSSQISATNANTINTMAPTQNTTTPGCCTPSAALANATAAITTIESTAAALNQQLQQQQQPNNIKITSKAREQLVGRPPYYVMFAIALAAMCLSFYCGIEITSMNYLATFAVNIDLQLPKSTAALMSSALTISFAIGRGFGIWIAAYMKPHKLFYLCAGVMATGNVLMLIFANTAEVLLWYSICLFGIGCGPMFPAIVSFYDDRISKVTNTVSGIFILGSMFNVALNSLIIGHHIIDNALILIVCNLIGSVLLLLLFGTLHMLTKVKKNQRVKKFKLRQQGVVQVVASGDSASEKKQQQHLDEQQVSLLQPAAQQNQLSADQKQPQVVAHEHDLTSQQEQQQSTGGDGDKKYDQQRQPLLFQNKQSSPNTTTTTSATPAPATADMVTVTIPTPDSNNKNNEDDHHVETTTKT